MYSKILVPLDGSQRAEAIMSHVQEMASRYHATVVLLSVVEPVYNTTGTYTGVPTYEIMEMEINRRNSEAQAHLEKWQTVLNDLGITNEAYVETGPVVRTILTVAGREAVDLIAMSSHGRTGLARVFYGSVAAGVLHQTSLPLLLVRALDDE